jgi:enoyl-CoA hydratase
VFCAGVDLRRIVAGGPDYVGQFWPALTEAFLAVFDHPGPLLAAVNGHAIAGGCVLAAACDVRLMSGATIGLTELLVGVPFPTSAMEIMRHATGAAAGQLALTGRPVLADQAHRIGLVDDVVEPDRLFDEAMARAESMAAIPAAAYAMTKRQLHAPARQRIEAGRADDDAAAAIWAAPHTLAAISGYLERLGSRRS